MKLVIFWSSTFKKSLAIKFNFGINVCNEYEISKSDLVNHSLKKKKKKILKILGGFRGWIFIFFILLEAIEA